jgi:transposase InsO family protein
VKVCKFFPARTASPEYRRGIASGLTQDQSHPGKPTDSDVFEAFGSELGAEGLHAQRVMRLADVRAELEDWRRDCIEV